MFWQESYGVDFVISSQETLTEAAPILGYGKKYIPNKY